MNEKQKKVLMCVAVIIMITLAFPPYTIEEKNYLLTGYRFIFDMLIGARIDIAALFTQWIGILLVGGITLFLVKDEK